MSQLRYDNGAAAFLEVLDAQRDLLSAEQQVVQIRRALQASRVSLYAALGGGSMDFVALSASDMGGVDRGILEVSRQRLCRVMEDALLFL